MKPEIGEYYYHQHDNNNLCQGPVDEEELIYLRVIPPAGWVEVHESGSCAAIKIWDGALFLDSAMNRTVLHTDRDSFDSVRIVRRDGDQWMHCSVAELRQMRRERWKDDD